MGNESVSVTGANIAFAQSPPGIGRKRPSLPGQPLGDPASGVPSATANASRWLNST